MKKKYLTTCWLDLLTYIILPFVTIVAVINVVKGLLYSTFSLSFLLALIAELVFICLYVLTFFTSYKRSKPAYFFFRVLIYATAVKAALDFTLTKVTNLEPILAFLVYLLAVSILWIYPNEKYFKNRKELFNKESGLKFLLPAKEEVKSEKNTKTKQKKKVNNKKK